MKNRISFGNNIFCFIISRARSGVMAGLVVPFVVEEGVAGENMRVALAGGGDIG